MVMDEGFEAVLFDLFGTLVTEEGQAVEGASKVLNELPRERWAIVTSCPASFAQSLVRRAGLPEPQVLVSANDVARGKPAPDCYLLAAQRLRVPPDRCLVIEDSRHGIEAGRAAGMHVINVREVALRDLTFVLEGPELRLRG